MALNLSPNSHALLLKPSTWNFTSLPDIIQRPMDKLNDNWDLLLPITEFAYNNTPNTSIGISSFFANKGYHPNITVHPEYDITSTWAHDFVVNLDELYQFLCDEITQAQSLLGTGQIDQDRSHKRRSMKCVGLGKAISNITLELKPLS
ncbi:uncharacterized protein ARMOST_16218 [Armillaria ostoyae]|uniref:Integrase catalytic domain-containing protein n=1 Tax=Armillaria ostoyae TaxID=47428 RepID=A0A284RVM2_ARMOS|nr:uncharacterized protein ARMOST_16218 [Armillaria ostoyae]